MNDSIVLFFDIANKFTKNSNTWILVPQVYLNLYEEAELLSHGVCTYPILPVIFKLFFKVLVPVYILVNTLWEIPFFHIFTVIVIWHLSFFFKLMDMKRYTF